jgi:hypothetical protein
MRLTDAMAFRDGGTTSITVAHGIFSRVSYTIDYSLPWDGRERYVSKGKPFAKDESQRLEVGGEEEARLHRWLTEALNRKFSATVVLDFVAGRTENPGKGKWSYALHFLKIITNERSQPLKTTDA